MSSGLHSKNHRDDASLPPSESQRSDAQKVRSLDDLAQLFVTASQSPTTNRHFATGVHAGLAAILQELVSCGHAICAYRTDRYDHRSLWEFTADLDRVSRLPLPPEDETPGKGL